MAVIIAVRSHIMALSAQHYQQPLCTEACRREAIEGSASATGLANPPCHGLLALWRKKREEEEGRKRGREGRRNEDKEEGRGEKRKQLILNKKRNSWWA